MNNEELKKKIVEILNESFTERDVIPVHTAPDGKKTALPDELCKIFNNIVLQAVIPYFADALIAAEIGDVKEAEAEANRYEMLYKMQSRDMALLERKVHEAEHRAKVLGRTLAIMKGKGLISGVVDDYIVQAEKELAEEGKE